MALSVQHADWSTQCNLIGDLSGDRDSGPLRRRFGLGQEDPVGGTGLSGTWGDVFNGYFSRISPGRVDLRETQRSAQEDLPGPSTR